MRGDHGFTLIEVLVALAIFAVALSAGLHATGAATDGASAFGDRLLAGWVAESRVEQHGVVAGAEPRERRGKVVQGARVLLWRESVTNAPASALWRIEIEVADERAPDHILARAVGYAPRPR
jgi:general secretion pathway protein I